MTYYVAKAAHAVLDAALAKAAADIRAFPKGPMGLTPDAVKATPEWRTAKAAYEDAFAKLRAFNGWYTKTYAKELAAERRVKRKGR